MRIVRERTASARFHKRCIAQTCSVDNRPQAKRTAEGENEAEDIYLSLAVPEREEVGAEDGDKGVEDAVANVNPDVTPAIAPLDVERAVKLVADRVLAV